MSKARTTRLQVQIDGRRRYISVPVERAKELHSYLRSKSVRSAPPEPASTGFDSIELALDSDVRTVQALLDNF